MSSSRRDGNQSCRRSAGSCGRCPRDSSITHPTSAPRKQATSDGSSPKRQRVLCDLLDTGVIDWKQRPRPATTAEIVKAWDEATAELRKRIEKLDEAKLGSPANFAMGDGTTWTDTIGNMLWGFLFDMVHHRGQLSAYLRPMGGKVPAIYGPSADDNGG